MVVTSKSLGSLVARAGLVVALALAMVVAVPKTGVVLAAERTIVSGTADDANVLGARWRKVPFDALSTGTASFRLEWTGAGLLHFNIFHSNGTLVGGNYGSTPSPKLGDLALVAGETYSARVWASSGVGVFELTVDEGGSDTSPPTTPEGLRAGAIGSSSIEIAWDPSIDDNSVSSYEVFRDGSPVGSTPTETFTDVGLLPDTTYAYTVRAFDPTGNASGLSSALNVTTLGDGSVQVRTIASGTADSTGALGARWRKVPFDALSTGTASFRLEWTGAGLLHFNIFHSNGTLVGGNYGSTPSPKLADLPLVGGQTYSARIWSSSGVGVFDLTVTERPTDTSPPSTPENVEVTAETFQSISLMWDPSVDDDAVSSYEVFRDGSVVGSTPTETFTDVGLLPGTTHAYTVRALDPSNNASSLSAPVSGTTTPDVTAPTTPANVHVTSENFQSISLAWDPSVDDDVVSAYEVYRNDELAGSTATEMFTDIGLSPDTAYGYTVRALDRTGNPSTMSTPITGTTASEADRQPNIIVINTDDQRRDSIDYLPKIKQWMGDGGTTFTNGYVSTPSCCPSRSTLMSGRYIHNNGQFGQQTLGFDQDLTVQRYLQDNGYFTGHSGKYLHWLSTGVVAPHWDRWTYFKGGYIDVWMRFDDVSRRSSGYSTTITFDRALEYLDDFESRDDDKPFYLQLTPIAPHSPYTPEAQYANASVPPHVKTPAHYETDRSDKPQWVIWRTRTEQWVENTRRQMIRTLYSVDDQVDRLMLRLEELGELDDTLVIFTSDNGYQWGEHQLGSKFLPYTHSVGVPFLIRWPGHVEAGAVDDRFVTHVDIAPTILAAAGVTQDLVPLDGHDILSGHDREFALTEYYYDVRNGNAIVTWAAIENDEFIYIEYYDQSRDRVSPTYLEYYDMVNDPYQLENLFDDGTTANDPDGAALSAQLAALKDCVGTTCP